MIKPIKEGIYMYQIDFNQPLAVHFIGIGAGV